MGKSSEGSGGASALTFSALALVGVGGAVGTLARYLLAAALPLHSSTAVLAINVAGSFVLGLLVAGFARRAPRLQLLLGTGFCGGFTTYSALAVGVAELARLGSAGGALALALGTVVAAALATVVGVWAGTAWSRAVMRRTLRGCTVRIGGEGE